MQATRKTNFAGYVKVEVRSRSPRLWGWGLCRGTTDIVMERSDVLYGHAEDAWKAGQAALEGLHLRPETAALYPATRPPPDHCQDSRPPVCPPPTRAVAEQAGPARLARLAQEAEGEAEAGLRP